MFNDYCTHAELAEFEKSDNSDVRRLAAHYRALGKEHLKSRMRELAQAYVEDVPADWGHAVWRAIIDGPVSMTEEEVNEVDQLGQIAGGWYDYSKNQNEPEFVEREDWLDLYDKYRDAQEADEAVRRRR